MSGASEYILACDGRRGLGCEYGSRIAHSTAKQARAEARGNGWKLGYGKPKSADLCPHCRAPREDSTR